MTKPFESDAEPLRRQRNSFNRALKQLQACKIKTRTDIEQFFSEYTKDRTVWERQLYHFADFLGYDWNEITGDRSLEDATDDAVIERLELLITDSKEARQEQA